MTFCWCFLVSQGPKSYVVSNLVVQFACKFLDTRKKVPLHLWSMNAILKCKIVSLCYLLDFNVANETYTKMSNCFIKLILWLCEKRNDFYVFKNDSNFQQRRIFLRTQSSIEKVPSIKVEGFQMWLFDQLKQGK